MADTSDSGAVVPHRLSDLFDVDVTTADATGAGILVKGAAAGAEWAKVAPAAAIADGTDAATTQAAVNAVLAALRARGIVASA